MPGFHLDRTGFRHGVLAIAALGALVASMWTSSSFIGPLSKHPFPQTPKIQTAYSVASQFSIAILVLNALTALVITIMSLVVDWHLDLRIPAYAEYAWVATALFIETIVIILTGVSAPPVVCSIHGSSQQVPPPEIVSAIAICSNWKAILSSSLIAMVFLTFHLAWHLIFRIWHRSALANRPNTPVDMWKTPLPLHYPISPREKQKDEDESFVTLEENGSAPVESGALHPRNVTSTPVAARKAQLSVKEPTKGHATRVPSIRVSVGDLETATSRDDVSFESTKAREPVPPGFEIVIETRKPNSKENS
ncbi:hypothetical protein BDV93DRAFT_545069 [Ceratobasidium sp. AG-I]|nr:hypothetical protein BDV93DRAFT_545069 [Ceratobasidium sp. AG-I]